MPNSLRAKLSKLRYKRKITDKEYQELIKKLDGHDTEVIDEFLSKAKERLNGFMLSEIQGEDMCPYSDMDGECHYMNTDIACSYCARQVDIEALEQIAEQLKDQEGNK